MNKEKISKFVSPLWLIAILLIVMNLLLWNISQKIGHDFIPASAGGGETIQATGLYKAIYYTANAIGNDVNSVQAVLEDLGL